MTALVRGFRFLIDQPYHLILGIFAFLGILYLAPKAILLQGDGGLDFRAIWLAGKLWSSGQNPYGPLFLKEYEVFGPGPDPIWLYPPYWFPMAVPFGLLPFPISNSVWKIFNFSLVITATHLSARALADVSRQKYVPIFFGGLGFVCFMQATAVTLFNGQTSILVYFGLSAIIFGLLKERSALVVIGLAFLALKPQVGIVAFGAVAVLPRYKWTPFLAGGICILATAPILFTGDYRATIEGFFGNLALHSSLVANTPANLTGLIHISDYLFSISIRTTILILAATTIAFAISLHSHLDNMTRTKNASDKVASLALIIASTLFLVPLHSYDLMALAVLLMMILAIPLVGRWLIALGLAMCIRAGNLSDALRIAHPGSDGFPESLLMSIALFLILLGTIWAVIVGRSQNTLPSKGLAFP